MKYQGLFTLKVKRYEVDLSFAAVRFYHGLYHIIH